ncbi:hypothetical protein BD779DRAFT_1676018 [Infundibulicybe gibba]|nr:hypothetical protein BD779DRAFT_1676018 [Infundibulicybe gibba]
MFLSTSKLVLAFVPLLLLCKVAIAQSPPPPPPPSPPSEIANTCSSDAVCILSSVLIRTVLMRAGR